jgi:UDP-glucose 4-epimerase
MIKCWVIGSGGLLGSALGRALLGRGVDLFTQTERFQWGNEQELESQLSAAVESFAQQAAAADMWQIYWAAGVGTLGSAAADLAVETKAMVCLLRLLEAQPQLAMTPGVIALASSAGAIFAGSADETITSMTPPAPTTAYAYEKLRQEDLLRSYVASNSNVTALSARISTLYGPGHSAGKKQGLIAHIARCVLRNEPVRIFVPFDTVRDYIFSDDVAARMISASFVAVNKPGLSIKIIASEQPASIAEIIYTFKRIARRAPRIVTSVCPDTAFYSRRIQFHSDIGEAGDRPRTSLLVGISQVLAAERTAYVRGRS